MIRLISKCASVIALIAAAMTLMFCAVVFADENPSLVASDSDPVVIDYAVNEEYPWVYDAELSDSDHAAWRAGNSGEKIKCVSNMAITVAGAGQLSFDYNISTPSGYSYGLFYNMDSPMTSELMATWVKNNSYPG